MTDSGSETEHGTTPLPHVAPSAVRAATGSAPLPTTSTDASPSAATVRNAPEPPGAASVDDPPEEPADEFTRAWRELPLQTRLEGLLFAATEPLSVRRLSNHSGEPDVQEVRAALEALGSHYDMTSRAFCLHEIGGGYQLRTRPEVALLAARVGRKPRNESLSQAALETLAIVAYRQPVLRADVEKIRGVASGEMIRSLIDKGLVRVTGRADLPGSPLLYGTTSEFLELFGLKGLGDLPTDRRLKSE